MNVNPVSIPTPSTSETDTLLLPFRAGAIIDFIAAGALIAYGIAVSLHSPCFPERSLIEGQLITFSGVTLLTLTLVISLLYSRCQTAKTSSSTLPFPIQDANFLSNPSSDTVFNSESPTTDLSLPKQPSEQNPIKNTEKISRDNLPKESIPETAQEPPQSLTDRAASVRVPPCSEHSSVHNSHSLPIESSKVYEMNLAGKGAYEKESFLKILKQIDFTYEYELKILLNKSGFLLFKKSKNGHEIKSQIEDPTEVAHLEAFKNLFPEDPNFNLILSLDPKKGTDLASLLNLLILGSQRRSSQAKLIFTPEDKEFAEFLIKLFPDNTIKNECIEEKIFSMTHCSPTGLQLTRWPAPLLGGDERKNNVYTFMIPDVFYKILDNFLYGCFLQDDKRSVAQLALSTSWFYQAIGDTLLYRGGETVQEKQVRSWLFKWLSPYFSKWKLSYRKLDTVIQLYVPATTTRVEQQICYKVSNETLENEKMMLHACLKTQSFFQSRRGNRLLYLTENQRTWFLHNLKTNTLTVSAIPDTNANPVQNLFLLDTGFLILRKKSIEHYDEEGTHLRDIFHFLPGASPIRGVLEDGYLHIVTECFDDTVQFRCHHFTEQSDVWQEVEFCSKFLPHLSSSDIFPLTPSLIWTPTAIFYKNKEILSPFLFEEHLIDEYLGSSKTCLSRQNLRKCLPYFTNFIWHPEAFTKVGDFLLIKHIKAMTAALFQLNIHTQRFSTLHDSHLYARPLWYQLLSEPAGSCIFHLSDDPIDDHKCHFFDCENRRIFSLDHSNASGHELHSFLSMAIQCLHLEVPKRELIRYLHFEIFPTTQQRPEVRITFLRCDRKKHLHYEIFTWTPKNLS